MYVHSLDISWMGELVRCIQLATKSRFRVQYPSKATKIHCNMACLCVRTRRATEADRAKEEVQTGEFVVCGAGNTNSPRRSVRPMKPNAKYNDPDWVQ
jgi:hypothetical protein